MRVLMKRLLLSESWRRCNLYRSEPKRAAWHPVEELQTYWHSTRTASALDGTPVCTGTHGPGSGATLASASKKSSYYLTVRILGLRVLRRRMTESCSPTSNPRTAQIATNSMTSRVLTPRS